MRARMRSMAMLVVLATLTSGCVYFARVTTLPDGSQIPGLSNMGDVSADGRFLVFTTQQSLVAADTNTFNDVYRKDLLTGDVLLVTQRNGIVGNGSSFDPVISDDGRWVAYSTSATNLWPSIDNNPFPDIVLYDTLGDIAYLASISDIGVQVTGNNRKPAISGDGQHVAWESTAPLDAADTNELEDIYRYDRGTGDSTLVSVSTTGTAGDGRSTDPDIDYDGSVVVFASGARNLVAGDTNTLGDIFATDGTTTVLVSVSASGAQTNNNSTRPVVSGDGTVVAFESFATNLVPTDSNGQRDVFAKSITGAIEIVSLADDGSQVSRQSSHASINHDGTIVAFRTQAPELHGTTAGTEVAVVRDRLDGRVAVGSTADDGRAVEADDVAIAADGIYLLFESRDATVLLPDDNGTSADLFLRWWSPPSIDSISPSTIALGASQPVTITGSGFNRFAETMVYSDRTGGDGTTFSNVQVVDHTTITATVETTVGLTPIGPRPLWLENSGEGPGLTSGTLVTCGSCLTVAL